MPKISVIIVLATPITPIPAVTLKHSMTHSCQNCGVFSAWSIWTLFCDIMPEATGFGVQPAGLPVLRGHAILERGQDHRR